MRNLITTIIICLLTVNLALAQSNPGKQWEKIDVSKTKSWDLAALKDYENFIIDSTKVTGLMLIHNGKVLFEYGDIEENSYIASCRKSILAILYGKYVDNGKIDLDETIGELGIDDVEGILPIEKTAKVRHLISARSGVFHPASYPGGMYEYSPARGSVVPGEYWLYSNWDFNVAGYVFEQKTKRNIYDEITRQLAKPLEMQDWDRSLQQKDGDPALSKYLAYPIWFSTRDMARVGQLMLNEGKWNGKQVISKAWFNEMIQQRTTHKEINKNVPTFRGSHVSMGYSYMWWLYENVKDPRMKGAYAAMGAMGQGIVIVPNIDLAVVFKTKAAYDRYNSGNTRLAIVDKAVALYQN